MNMHSSFRPSRLEQATTRDRGVCEARRTRSRLLTPWPLGTPPGLSAITTHEGPDSPYTINAATTPWRGLAEWTARSRRRPCLRVDATMQICRTDHPGSRPHRKDPVAGGRGVCEVKRIWSHYFLLDAGQASRALHPGPRRWQASPYTINAATMQICRTDPPGSRRHRKDPVTGGRGVCEAKRIWSHYFLLDVGQASRALHRGPRKWQASPYTINAATMQICRTDLPGSRDSSM
jgi:hypothetical protein